MHRLSVRQRNAHLVSKEIVVEFNSRFKLHASVEGKCIRLTDNGRERRVFTSGEFQQNPRSCLQELAITLSQQQTKSYPIDGNFIIPLDSAFLVIGEKGDSLKVGHCTENNSEGVQWDCEEFARDPATVLPAFAAAIGLFQRSNLDAFFDRKSISDKTEKVAGILRRFQ